MLCSPLPQSAVKAIEMYQLLSNHLFIEKSNRMSCCRAQATGNSIPLRRLTLFLDDVADVFGRVYGSRIAHTESRL